MKIIEPSYFSNWGDLFYPKIANYLLPLIAKMRWISPNIVTIGSFAFYIVASVFLFLNFPYHLLLSAILLPSAYILDCLDGQLARFTNRTSLFGDYLDKTLDVLKIFIVTFSLSINAYLATRNVLYIFLGFTACFFFNFRYYIKLETIFSSFNRDKEYLLKSKEKRNYLYEEFELKYKYWSKTFIGKVKKFIHKNRAIFLVDEAEFVTFTSIAALFNKIELALWILAISQIIIAFWRLFERGYQIETFSKKLLWPMRK